jgi:hypothetical protein
LCVLCWGSKGSPWRSLHLQARKAQAHDISLIKGKEKMTTSTTTNSEPTLLCLFSFLLSVDFSIVGAELASVKLITL